METKEAILATISEFNNANFSIADDTNDEKYSKNVFIDIKEENETDSNSAIISDEVAMLMQLKEKSLVLFEGLRNAKKEDLEMKLEMIINYLEYQLYIIEDRLKNLQEQTNAK